MEVAAEQNEMEWNETRREEKTNRKLKTYHRPYFTAQVSIILRRHWYAIPVPGFLFRYATNVELQTENKIQVEKWLHWKLVVQSEDEAKT